MEIPDAVSEFVSYFDAVLLEKHGALTYSDSLEAAYMKMESVEFYAQLLYQSKLLGVPRELTPGQMEELYELRRQSGMQGRHPANLGEPADACRFHCANCGRKCEKGD